MFLAHNPEFCFSKKIKAIQEQTVKSQIPPTHMLSLILFLPTSYIDKASMLLFKSLLLQCRPQTLSTIQEYAEAIFCFFLCNEKNYFCHHTSMPLFLKYYEKITFKITWTHFLQFFSAHVFLKLSIIFHFFSPIHKNIHFMFINGSLIAISISQNPDLPIPSF